MSNYKKKKFIFDVFSKQLNDIKIQTVEGPIIQLIDSYVCPLCLEIFTIDKISELTVEHIPPKSVGGTGSILTCKHCNNTCGKDLAIALQLELQIRDFDSVQLKDGVDSKVQCNDISVNCITKYQDKKILFTIDEKRNNPGTISQLFSELKNNTGEYTIKVDSKIGNKPRNIEAANASILKSAYLLAFWCLGYRYILHDSLKIVRKLIEELPTRTDCPGFVAFIVKETLLIKNNREGLYTAKVNGLDCLVVLMDMTLIEHPKRHRAIAILPHHEDTSGVVYKRIIDSLGPEMKITFGYRYHKWPKVTHNNHCSCPYDLC